MIAYHWVYSNSLNEMVIKGFSRGTNHYTWSDLDCVYYRDDVDDIFYFEIPYWDDVVLDRM